MQAPFISAGLSKDPRKISSPAHAHGKGCGFPAKYSNQGSRIQFEVQKGTAPFGQATLISEAGSRLMCNYVKNLDEAWVGDFGVIKTADV